MAHQHGINCVQSLLIELRKAARLGTLRKVARNVAHDLLALVHAVHRRIEFFPELDVDGVGHLVLDGAGGAHGFGERLADDRDELGDFGERLRRDGPDFEGDLGNLRAGGFDEVANLSYGCKLCVEAQRDSRSGKVRI